MDNNKEDEVMQLRYTMQAMREYIQRLEGYIQAGLDAREAYIETKGGDGMGSNVRRMKPYGPFSARPNINLPPLD